MTTAEFEVKRKLKAGPLNPDRDLLTQRPEPNRTDSLGPSAHSPMRRRVAVATAGKVAGATLMLPATSPPQRGSNWLLERKLHG